MVMLIGHGAFDGVEYKINLPGPDLSAGELASLLDAHHYTDGLEFLPFGTPTNNTDARRGAATKDDPLHQRSFAVEIAFDPASRVAVR